MRAWLNAGPVEGKGVSKSDCLTQNGTSLGATHLLRTLLIGSAGDTMLHR